MKKLIITGPIAHFKYPYATRFQNTYLSPPPSTVIGMLKVIFGEKIDDFMFGYIFDFEDKFRDLMTVYKNAFSFDGENRRVDRSNNMQSDIAQREYLHDVELHIYTNIDLPIKMEHTLCLGRSNCLARLHLPFSNVELSQKEGEGIYQYVLPEFAKSGVVRPFTVYTKFNQLSDKFDTKVKQLCFAESFTSKGFYDEDLEESIFMWHVKGGEVNVSSEKTNI